MKKRILAMLCSVLLALPAFGMAEAAALPSAGDLVTFGSYPLGYSESLSPIEWLVLDVQDDCALLVSRYVLDCQPLNRTMELSLNWMNSGLRSWLTGTFYDAAFDAEEKAAIIPAGDLGRVFLLSGEEVVTCFREGHRDCSPTDYAQIQGIKPAENGCCSYWTRDPGALPGQGAVIDSEGLNGYRDAVEQLGVRPVILVRPDALQIVPAGSAKVANAADDSPDALRAMAEAAGMAIPEPAEGEKLYLGVADVPDTRQTRLFLAFIASQNDMSIRFATLFGEALEVPQEGKDPWLINNQTRTVEDHWILLDAGGGTDILLDEASGLGVYDLAIDGSGGSCRMTVAGHCEKPRDSVDGDFRAEAEVKLVNLTGETAAQAIDPPTLEQVQAAGMKLEAPAEGEGLYLGAADVSQAGALYIAFTLSPDGGSIHDLTVFVQDMDIEYRLDNKRVHTTSSSRSVVANDFAVDEDIALDDIRLSGFTIDGERAEGVLRYSFHATDDNIDYPFDPARVQFARVK